MKRFRGGALNPRMTFRDDVLDEDGHSIDDVLAVCYQNPRSYTGEDVVEISGHGGIHVTRRVLERCLECGARLAEAGEFSLRAFLNSKLDLTQAEGCDGFDFGTDGLGCEGCPGAVVRQLGRCGGGCPRGNH